MNYRVLLAVADLGLVSDFEALALESGEITVTEIVRTAPDVVAALSSQTFDVVVLHEHLGPLPVLDLARRLAARTPEVGLVLLAREGSETLATAALRAGFRGIVTQPLSLEDLQTTIADAGAWAHSLRARFEQADDQSGGVEGRMVVVAGAKGGVGTTTIAVHLALIAARVSPSRTVCLVDFDLQKGDVRSLLDLSHRRSVADLVDVAEDITSRQLEESLSMYHDGLRVLLPPPEGEYWDAVVGDAGRRILGGIRARFDLVIVDVGTVVSEGSAVATEMADQVVLVVTPDVPAMRAANRLLGLWERLQIRKEGIGVLVNRFSRDSEIQQELVGRIVNATVLKTTLPADFRALESPANTGVPSRLEDGRFRQGLARLASELRLNVAEAAEQPPGGQRRSRRRDRAPASAKGEAGQASIETAALIGGLLFLVLVVFQLVLAGATMILAGHAARQAAGELALATPNEANLEQRLEDAAREDLFGSWNRPEAVEVRHTYDDVTVTLTVPPLLPERLLSSWQLSTTAGTIRERAPVDPPSPGP